MNERFDFTTAIEPDTFDRLVDGELNLAEERALFAALDIRPDDWRRCALAFLEARALRDGCSIAIGRPRAKTNGTPQILPTLASHPSGPDAERSHRRQRSRTVALAASIAVAFLLGIAAHWQWTLGGSAIRERIAIDAPGPGQTDMNIAQRGNPRSKVDVRQADYVDSVTMALVDQDGHIERQIQVPVVETNQLDPSWLPTAPSAIPDQFVQALRRSGHTVQERRLYLPVVLRDGRQAIVALDQAQVKYNGMRF